MRNKLSRFIAMLLLVAMFVTMVPVQIFAEEPDVGTGVTDYEEDEGGEPDDNFAEGDPNSVVTDLNTVIGEGEGEGEGDEDEEFDVPAVTLYGDGNVSVSGDLDSDMKLAVTSEPLVNTGTEEEPEYWACYDITLLDAEGNPVQPNGYVEVSLPVFEETGLVYSAWYLEEGADPVNMGGYRAGDSFIFETDHFSRYGLMGVPGSDEEDPKDPQSPPEEPGEPKCLRANVVFTAVGEEGLPADKLPETVTLTPYFSKDGGKDWLLIGQAETVKVSEEGKAVFVWSEIPVAAKKKPAYQYKVVQHAADENGYWKTESSAPKENDEGNLIVTITNSHNPLEIKNETEFDVTVTGAPDGTILTVGYPEQSAYKDAVMEKVGGEFYEAMALDIKVTDAQGGALTEPVSIRVTSENFKHEEYLPDDAVLYHVTGGEAQNTPYALNRDAGTLIFSAQDFSPFVVPVAAPEENPDVDPQNLPEEMSLTANVEFKIFPHNNGEDKNKLPDDVVLTLKYREDENAEWKTFGETQTLTLNDVQRASYTWNGVPAAAEGEPEYQYIVEETGADESYWQVITHDAEKTNTGLSISIKNCPPLSFGYSLDWSLGYSSSVVAYHYDESHNLIIHPNNAADGSAKMTVSVKINGDSDQTVPEGAVRIVIPGTIFDGFAGVGKGYTGVQLITQVPKAPGTSKDISFNYTIDPATGDYIVTNWAALPGGNTIGFDVSYNYSPTCIPGGYLVSGTYGKADAVYGGNYTVKNFSVPITIDCDPNDGKLEVDETRQLTYEFHTRGESPTVALVGAADNRNGIFFSWQNGWGENPDPDGDYFYIVWETRIARNDFGSVASQPFNTEVEVIEDNNQGTLVGVLGSFGKGGHPYSRSGNEYPTVNRNYPGIAGADWDTRLNFTGFACDHSNTTDGNNPTFLTYVPQQTRRTVCLLMRYPMSILEKAQAAGVDLVNKGVEITNSVKASNILISSETIGDTTYGVYPATASGKIMVRINPGGGTASFGKGGASTSEAAQTSLLMGKNVRLYPTGQSSTAYAYSISSTITPDCAKDPATGKAVKPYTITIEDGDMYMNTLTTKGSTYWPKQFSAMVDPVKLTPGEDYTFTHFYLTMTEYDGECDGGSWFMSTTASTDYGRMNGVDVYCDGVPFGTVTKDAKGYTFKGTDGTQQTVSESSPVRLPAGAANIKFVHESDYYQSNVYVRFGVTLKSSDRVVERVKKDHDGQPYAYTGVTNIGKYSLKQANKDTLEYETTYSNDETKNITGLTWVLNKYSYSHTFSKIQSKTDALSVDSVASLQTRPVAIAAGLSYAGTHSGGANSADPDLPKAVGAYYHKATIYDLLPKGTRVDPSKVVAASQALNATDIRGKFPASWYTARTEDIEGVGTMLIVDFDIPGDGAASLAIAYPLENDFINIEANGTNVINQCVLVDGNENGETKYIMGNAAKRTNVSNPEAFDEWNPIAYAQTNVTYNAVTLRQAGFNKYVSSDNTTGYSDKTEVHMADGYSYLLRFKNEETTKSGSITFYDLMENGGQSQWQGKLRNIIVSTAVNNEDSAATVAPVIYYSDVELTKDNLTTYSGWKSGLPADTSAVKAIKVDCTLDSKGNPFVLGPNKTLTVTLDMSAPADEAKVGKEAINFGYVYYNPANVAAEMQNGGTPLVENFANASVVLRGEELTLTKASNPVTGTEAEPAVIANKANQKITYSLTLKNDSSTLAYNNVVLEDPIPDGLTIDTANIKVLIKNAAGGTVANNVLVSSRSDIRLTQDGQTLSFNIGKLQPGYTFTFSIPTAQVNPAVKTTKYFNTARITKIGNHEEDIESETTYHKVTQQYSLTYNVIDIGDGLITGTCPDQVTGLEYEDVVDMEPGSETTETTKVIDGHEVTGKWVFLGWYDTEDDAKAAYTAFTNDENVAKPLTNKTILQDENVYGGFVFVQPTVDVIVTKSWDDEPYSDARPEKIMLQLYRDGDECGEPVAVTKEDRWSASWKKLPQFVGGKKVEYDVFELSASGEKVPEREMVNGIYAAGYEHLDPTFDEDALKTSASIIVTNTLKIGELTIEKELKGNDVDTNKEFSFTITLTNGDKPVKGTFSDVEFDENGKATIKLKGGEAKTFDDLPNGTEFTVVEDNSSAGGYTCNHPDGVTGTIDKDEKQLVQFVNERNTYGNLTVSKKVAGDGASKTEKFEFTVKLSDKSISGKYGDMTFKQGVATFKLKHRQKITAKGLPNGVKYTVKEAKHEDYKATKTGETGTITGNKTATAKFTNTYTGDEGGESGGTPSSDPGNPGGLPRTGRLPRTGDTSNMLLWILLILGATAVMTVTLLTGKRYKGKYTR